MKQRCLKVNDTIITNKRAKGKKGSIAAICSGAKVDPILEKLRSIPSRLRDKVREITLDIVNTMKNITTKAFPKAIQVIGRFYVQKPALEALESIRIQYQ